MAARLHICCLFDWEDKIVDSGAEFYGYQNHKKLSEQIKKAYSAADSIVESFDFEKSNGLLVYISLGTVIKCAVSFFRNCVEAFRRENVDVIISVGQKFDISKLKDIPSKCSNL